MDVEYKDDLHNEMILRDSKTGKSIVHVKFEFDEMISEKDKDDLYDLTAATIKLWITVTRLGK